MTVLFPNSITNQGGHFQESSGVFLCPVSGLYLFFNALTAPVQKYCAADTVQDFEEYVATMQAYQFNTQAASLSFLTCSDIGSVRLSTKYTDQQCSGSASLRTTTFTGLLISENDPSAGGTLNLNFNS